MPKISLNFVERELARLEFPHLTPWEAERAYATRKYMLRLQDRAQEARACTHKIAISNAT